MTKKNKRSFYSCDNPSHMGETNTWYTPKEIIKPLGMFDLDPCTNSSRPFDTAKNHIEHDLGDCGLTQEWYGRVWCNPPYGKNIIEWVEKMAVHNNGVMLVFNRTETKWAQFAISSCDAVLFLSGRISFIRSNGEKATNAATGSMLLAWGGRNFKSLYNLKGVLLS